MIDAIRDRRSIRKYKREPVRKALIDQILQAGILAPSSKNWQPWKFIVATGSAKDEACRVMEDGISRERSARSFWRAVSISVARSIRFKS